MWEKALECTLRLQIEIDGKLTAWAQQYDSKTGKPATGRSFELPSICTYELPLLY
jgi:PelA/Pel-15E family pectate lyase